MITTREQIKGTMLIAMSEYHSGNSDEAHRIVDAQIAAIEAAGVRMVPDEPRVGMFKALTESWGDSPEARRGIGQWALGRFREDYRAMLAASPYAKGKPE